MTHVQPDPPDSSDSGLSDSDFSDSLVFEADFDEPPEKVWRALTEPQLLAVWLTPEESAAAERQGVGVVDGDGNGRGDRNGRDDGRDGSGAGSRAGASAYELVAAEPHRRLRYHWRDRTSGLAAPDRREVHSIVTIELAPGPAGGTHLRLTHGKFKVVATTPTLMALRLKSRRRTNAGHRRRRARILALAPARARRRAA